MGLDFLGQLPVIAHEDFDAFQPSDDSLDDVILNCALCICPNTPWQTFRFYGIWRPPGTWPARSYGRIVPVKNRSKKSFAGRFFCTGGNSSKPHDVEFLGVTPEAREQRVQHSDEVFSLCLVEYREEDHDAGLAGLFVEQIVQE